MTAAANFNGKIERIEADDAVMLVADHRSGLLQMVEDMPRRGT